MCAGRPPLHSAFLLFAGVVILSLGCGPRRERPPLSASFARIQVEEARIERASSTAASGPDRIASRNAVCASADALCAAALEADDRDADLRCTHAWSLCESALFLNGEEPR
jgi:hypothetical protein